MKKSHDYYMQKAINAADRHQTPYGCVIVHHDSGAYFTAWNQTKALGKYAHAEMMGLIQLQEKEWEETSVTLYTTGEPCTMCMSAMIWYGIPEVYFGVPIEKISSYHHQISIKAKEIVASGFRNVHLEGPLLEVECLKLFDKWG